MTKNLLSLTIITSLSLGFTGCGSLSEEIVNEIVNIEYEDEDTTSTNYDGNYEGTTFYNC